MMAVLAAVLAALTMRGLHSPWPIYLVAALSSAAGAFDGPARHALIPNLVPRDHLANAISLNTIMFQVAAVAGPSAAGVIIATSGVGWAYALNAASFLFVIAALLAMRGVEGRGPRRSPRRTGRAGAARQRARSSQGFRFLLGHHARVHGGVRRQRGGRQ